MTDAASRLPRASRPRFALLGSSQVKLIAPRLGQLQGNNGEQVKIDFSFLTCSSVLFDAVYVPGGAASIETLLGVPKALHFINEAFKHCKAIAVTGAAVDLLQATYLADKVKHASGKGVVVDEGVVISRDAPPAKVIAEFIKAIAQHRHWSREQHDHVPA